MKKTTLAIAVLVMLSVAGTAMAECTTCGDAYNWDEEAPEEEAQLFAREDARPVLNAFAIVDGLALAALFLSFSLKSRDAQKAIKRQAFNYGLLPGACFFVLSLFFVALAHLIGWSMAVLTSGFGLLLGVIFAVYTLYVLND